MRTTLDLPDELLRLAKARAALRGMKLKDFVAEALANTLYYDRGSGSSLAADEAEKDDVLRIDEAFALPLIRGECGPELAHLRGGNAAELLEQADVEQASRPRRR